MPDYWDLPYPSRRQPVLAKQAVATSQPLAAQAGLRMLEQGGSAADAAIATAAALTVVEPCSNGIGSDAFAIISHAGELHGLNSSGRSPAAWSPARFAGLTEMPRRGWDSVTVPGAVAAWAAVHERFGRLPFERLLEPAISYAQDGFPVGPITAPIWQRNATRLTHAGWQACFAPAGRAPQTGERFRSADMASTLREIAATKGTSFYHGDLAEAIASCSAAEGGALSAADLAAHQAEWVALAHTDFADITLHEIPPNGQGLAALIALAICRERDVGQLACDSIAAVHVQIEAMKLALADAYAHIADPACMQHDWHSFLEADYIRSRAELITDEARMIDTGKPVISDTVYLCAADREGMMVSFIQSNYDGFGSGIVVPGTGISLQNRGHGFVLTDGHPNQVGGSKRPFHTIIPGFITRAGEALTSFGVMGGAMQAQGHLQVCLRMHAWGQNAQAAIDAPRWRVHRDSLWLEQGFSPELADALAERGHQLVSKPSSEFGGGQAITRLADGYLAASDWRKEGCAVGS